MWGFKNGLAEQLGIQPEDIHVISPFVGGAFGSPRLADPAHRHRRAARRRMIGRPVKLMTTRDQGFTIATYRAETRHHIKLGATRDGKLSSLTP